MTATKLADAHAERCTLGSVLLEPAALFTVATIVKPADFTVEKHQTTFEVMLELERAKQPVDVVSISSMAHGRVELRDLVALTDMIPTAANARHYATIVRNKSRLRRLVAEAQQLIKDASTCDDPQDLGSAMIGRMLDVLNESDQDEVVPARVWAYDFSADLERRKAEKEAPGLRSAFNVIDGPGGLRRRNVTLLGARPGLGKTALACNISLELAMTGHRVLFGSLEMSRPEIVTRLVANRASVNIGRIDDPQLLDTDDWTRTTNALRSLHELDFSIWAPARATIDQLRVHTLRLSAIKPVDLLVVDYVQLLRGERGDGREREVASVSAGLKAIAKEAGCALLGIAQLNRAVEHRDDHTPKSSDLRDSGALEQDASMIAFLHRARGEGGFADEVDFVMTKNRFGPIDTGVLRWLPQLQRFTNAT